MTKLEELLKEYCPEGVEYKTLGEVCEYIRGKGLSKTIKGTGIEPIVLYGELYTTYGDYIDDIVSYALSDYCKSSVKIKKGSILLPISSTTKEAQIGKASVLKVDSVYLGGDAVAIYPNANLDSDFLMYVMNGYTFEVEKMRCVKGTTIRHLDIEKLLKIRVPLPPLAAQREIVRILDNFTLLSENLAEELAARLQQYEHYRDELLTFGDEVPRMKLGEVCKFVRGPFGGSIKKECFVNDGYAVYEQQHAIYGKLDFRYYVTEEKFTEMKRFAVLPGDIIMSCSGTMGKFFVVPLNAPKGIINQALLKLTPTDGVQSKFLSYYFSCDYFVSQIAKFSQGGAIKNVASVAILKDIEIPVPPLAEQERIVKILDKFDALCHDLTAGLPAEIEARRQQYEYYRDKLLTFEEKKKDV